MRNCFYEMKPCNNCCPYNCDELYNSNIRCIYENKPCNECNACQQLEKENCKTCGHPYVGNLLVTCPWCGL